jgi:hypothetical protein
MRLKAMLKQPTIIVLNRIREFVRDLCDKSAERKNSAQAPDYAALAAAILPGILSIVESAQRVTANVFAVPALLLTPLTLCLGIAWSTFVVISKVEEERILEVPIPPTRVRTIRYRYMHVARQCAKVLLLAFVVLLPRSLTAAFRGLNPLPKTFYGYLLNARDGSPIHDVRVRVLGIDGANLTDGEWRTDSYGFYIMKTLVPGQRTSKLIVYLPDCGSRLLLPLTHAYEQWVPHPAGLVTRDVRPVFRHFVSCDQSND